MFEVRFCDDADDELLKFAVIIAWSGGKWVFCRHRDRDTYEIPGGHREKGEAILDTAKRELYEETGALDFTIVPVCVYVVTGKNRVSGTGEETFGKLFYAEITAFEESLHSEIEEVIISSDLPEKWTYPTIQPRLLEKTRELGFIK